MNIEVKIKNLDDILQLIVQIKPPNASLFEFDVYTSHNTYKTEIYNRAETFIIIEYKHTKISDLYYTYYKNKIIDYLESNDYILCICNNKYQKHYKLQPKLLLEAM